MTVKKGDFTTRMPTDELGITGKICDAINEIIEKNEMLTSELGRISEVVGREGKIAQRAALTATAPYSASRRRGSGCSAARSQRPSSACQKSSRRGAALLTPCHLDSTVGFAAFVHAQNLISCVICTRFEALCERLN